MESANAGKPILNVLMQYVKDLSFENPNSPLILRIREKVPRVNVSINVNTITVEENHYEVLLTLRARAGGEGNELVFNVELVYGGLFKIQYFAHEHMRSVLFIECPRLLFPFARRIIADNTRDGGFPPLMVDPVDFATLLQKRLSEKSISDNILDKST